MNILGWVATLGYVLSMATSASAAQFRLAESDQGEYMLTASGGAGFSRATVSIVCAPTKSNYALILVSPELGVLSRNEDVAIAADGASVMTRRFERVEESLMLLADGSAGRQLIDKASSASTLELQVSGRRIGFPLSQGAEKVAEFRTSCGF